MSDWEDKLEIRELIERWVLWRDGGEWERFRSLWHDDGKMAATWTQSPVDEFIKLAREGQARGVNVIHFLGGQAIELAGDRAISQTKMTISQRGLLEGVECDVVCTGRFYDFLERRKGRWGLVFRQPIYEKDRADPVDTSVQVKLNPELLKRFPPGYRHLAYLQSQIGYPVKADMPGLGGDALDALKARGAAWLTGKAIFDEA